MNRFSIELKQIIFFLLEFVCEKLELNPLQIALRI